MKTRSTVKTRITPPVTLDDDNLRALIERTRRWMRDEDFPRSETELAAMRRVEQHLRFMLTAARLGSEIPW